MNIQIAPDESVCANCAHFHQHYIPSSENPEYAVAIQFGHCVYPRVKSRIVTDTCVHFAPKKESDAR